MQLTQLSSWATKLKTKSGSKSLSCHCNLKGSYILHVVLHLCCFRKSFGLIPRVLHILIQRILNTCWSAAQSGHITQDLSAHHLGWMMVSTFVLQHRWTDTSITTTLNVCYLHYLSAHRDANTIDGLLFLNRFPPPKIWMSQVVMNGCGERARPRGDVHWWV